MVFRKFGNAFIALDQITKVEVIEHDFGPNGSEKALKITINDDATVEIPEFDANKDPFLKQFFTNRIIYMA